MKATEASNSAPPPPPQQRFPERKCRYLVCHCLITGF